MTAIASCVTQLERRRIEAEILAEAYGALCRDMPAEKAVEYIAQATAAAARKAGRAFAASAPNGPSLAHFAGVIDVWTAGGALDIRDVCLDDTSLSLVVTRCGYAAFYLDDMGLPPELAFALSCSRDGAFAQGYSPRLLLERPETIVQGAPGCPFRYRWQD